MLLSFDGVVNAADSWRVSDSIAVVEHLNRSADREFLEDSVVHKIVESVLEEQQTTLNYEGNDRFFDEFSYQHRVNEIFTWRKNLIKKIIDPYLNERPTNEGHSFLVSLYHNKSGFPLVRGGMDPLLSGGGSAYTTLGDHAEAECTDIDLTGPDLVESGTNAPPKIEATFTANCEHNLEDYFPAEHWDINSDWVVNLRFSITTGNESYNEQDVPDALYRGNKANIDETLSRNCDQILVNGTGMIQAWARISLTIRLRSKHKHGGGSSSTFWWLVTPNPTPTIFVSPAICNTQDQLYPPLKGIGP